jgi:hypothetical protein
MPLASTTVNTAALDFESLFPDQLYQDFDQAKSPLMSSVFALHLTM